MSELVHLFQPGRIGSLEVKNRLVMTPMVTRSSPNDRPDERHEAFYRQRAEGGVGMIVVQATCVLPEGHPKGWYGIWDDSFLLALSKVAQAIKSGGARAAIQLHHGGHASPQAVGPSATARARAGRAPRELSREEIALTIEGFIRAAERAQQAGFDAIELHGAGAYLINNFFSPLANQRRDEYGGSIENRARFAMDILSGMRVRLGPGYPLGIRMGPSDFLPDGSSPEEVLLRAPLMVKAGADFLDITPSGHGSLNLSYLHQQGTITPLAAAIRKAVSVPIFVAGKISDPAFADQVIARGQTDFVALGRPLLADPQWPNKAREGRVQDIRRCIYCTLCSGGGGGQTPFPFASCSVNPSLAATWRGEDYGRLEPAAKSRRVLVAGGGLAGMHAATVLARRGHRVSLYEAGGELGGQWRVAYHQDYKKDSNFPQLLELTVRELKGSGAEVRLNTPLTAEVVARDRPDAVVVATGASPVTPDIPGVGSRADPEVVQANDILMGEKEVIGERAIVIGAGYVGMETALHLAERGKRVYLLTRSKVGRRVGLAIRRTLVDRLIEAGVYLFPDSPVVEVVPGGVKYVSDGEYRYLKADAVVLAVGVTPQAGLAKALAETGVEMHTIGDVVEPRDAFSALHEAAALARKL
ncbi:MAG: FAD-dependent oxidoreductase [Chloroflexi bacterium]|nr:FAD-dependent oxidoreductase [Chloroflexota bacterium]